ncbi:MAG: hypothetical protein U0R19_33825 [Bryobacteraceae bacterium]
MAASALCLALNNCIVLGATRAERRRFLNEIHEIRRRHPDQVPVESALARAKKLRKAAMMIRPLHWLVFLPAGVIAGGLVGAMIIFVANYFIGGWRLLSGISIYMAGIWSPVFFRNVSLFLGPPGSRLAGGIVVLSLAVLAIVGVTGVASVLLGQFPLAAVPVWIHLSRSLTPAWQFGLLFAGLIVGSLAAIFRAPPA